MKKYTALLFSLIGAAILCNSALAHTVKHADDVFKKWHEWQQIMPDKDLNSMTESLNDAFVATFKNHYEKTASILAPITPFLDAITASHISKNGYFLRSPLSPSLKDNLSVIYNTLQNDIPLFIKTLQQSDLTSQEHVKNEETAEGSSGCIEKYNALYKLLFASSDESLENQYLFTIANKFYEYCFNEATFPDFERMLLDKSLYPICRMLYSVSWYNLAGNGWKHWHEKSLKTLKERADQGKEIVYIAGGSDLYQMIKAGIYNIRNIDPQLPSQPKYYTNEWTFLLRGEGPDGGIGDKIIFNFDNRTVIMERIEFKMLGTTFKARIATGDVIELPHSITTWKFTDNEGKELGKYTLERRFCQQSDFYNSDKRTMLLSFNELYFVCLPNFLNGWMIEPSKFPQDLDIVIKQLRKPVTRQMVVNMRIAALLNSTDFKYIALGTCIN